MAEELITEFIYELQKPIIYSYKGDTKEATFISLNAPSSKNLKECSFLKQAFFRALQDQKDDGKKDEDKKESTDIKGDDIMALISMSNAVDLDKVLLHMGKLLISNEVALLDGDTQMKQTHVDKMGYEELEILTGKYLEVFILASSLKKLKEESLK